MTRRFDAVEVESEFVGSTPTEALTEAGEALDSLPFVPSWSSVDLSRVFMPKGAVAGEKPSKDADTSDWVWRWVATLKARD